MKPGRLQGRAGRCGGNEMKKDKKRRIFAAVIAAVLIAAMVLPLVMSAMTAV